VSLLHRLILPAAALCAVAAGPATASATTLHVASGASPLGATGEADHPFATITEAVENASSGDLVQVGPGLFAESVTIEVGVTIEGAPGLRTVIEPPTAWTLDAPGAALRGLLFEGSGARSYGVNAFSSFTIEECQLQDFGGAIRVDGVGGDSTIANNRILNNRYGVGLFDSGTGTAIAVVNNQIVAPTGTAGIYASGARYTAAFNQISGQRFGVYHRVPAGDSTAISAVQANLITDVFYGVAGSGVGPNDVKVLANSIDAVASFRGLLAADVTWNIDEDCGADSASLSPLDHGFTPGGSCADAFSAMPDPDGSPADVGPSGGPYGGPWWQDLGCAGPHVFCPAQELEDWLEARPAVRDSLWWYDTESEAFEPYDLWSDDLAAALFDGYTAAWYGYASELAEPMPNILELAPTDYAYTAHTPEDATDLFLSLVIESFRTELQARVPWTVDDYDADELAVLFDGRNVYTVCTDMLFLTCPEGDTTLRFVNTGATPAAGPYTWDFVQGELGVEATRMDLIAAAMEWSRDHMFHQVAGFSGQTEAALWHWGFAGATPVSRVTDGWEHGPHPLGWGADSGFRHYARGCSGTVQWLREILRVANLPVIRINKLHSLAYFPTEGLYLDHGDNPYNRYSRTADYPATELLIDADRFADWFPEGSGDENVGRRVFELNAIWLPTALLEDRCWDMELDRSKADGYTFAALDLHYDMVDLEAMGFWVAIDTKIVELGICDVPLPPGAQGSPS